jgi:hypothetical protein
MNQPASSILVLTRKVLLDALEALADHRDSVIVVGAQAVYLHTGNASVAIAEATKDSDLAVDPRSLGADPLIQEAMEAGGFLPDPHSGQPGAWISPEHIPVDLMVPRKVDGTNRLDARAVKIPPHDRRAMRSTSGLEGALVDNQEMDIHALDPDDKRLLRAKVAGPAALVVAKLHKIHDRTSDTMRQLDNKDAHDVYRLFLSMDVEHTATSLRQLIASDIAGNASALAMRYLEQLFAAGPDARGCQMVAVAEGEVGEAAEIVAQRCAFLAQDLVDAVRQVR